MDQADVLRFEAVKKHFPVTKGLMFARQVGQVHAVDGIDLAVAPGQTLALVGESGCGKTTTARLVLRLETPTEGRVVVEGEDIHQLKGPALKSYRTRVQAVFQDPWNSLNPRMQVRKIVAETLQVNYNLAPQRDGRPGGKGDAGRGVAARTGARFSPRVQRRPAPAHRHCQRADFRAQAGDPG